MNGLVKRFRPGFIGLFLFAILTASLSAAPAASPELANATGAPVISVDDDFLTTGACRLHQWVVLGTFPCPAEQVGQTAPGVPTGPDWLAPLGGEAKAILHPGLAISPRADGATTQPAMSRLVDTNKNGLLDFLAIYKDGPKEKVAAYAFAYVQSSREQTVHGFISADDAARIYVNNALVKCEKLALPRGGSNPAQFNFFEHFAVKLHPGLNPVLVKVAQTNGAWNLALEFTPEDAGRKIVAELDRRKAIREFQYVAIGPKDKWQHTFNPGSFPELAWEDEKVVVTALGKLPALKVRWFDDALNEVTKAEKPGRYAAYVEAAMPDGRKIRRAMTFFCVNPEWRTWNSRVEPTVPYLPGPMIDAAVWSEQQQAINHAAMDSFMSSMWKDEGTAALFAGLAEAKPLGHPATQLDMPWNTNLEYQLKLKRKILGLPEQPAVALKAPHKKEGAPAPVLHEGTPEQAGMKPDARERIHAACQAWFDATQEPFQVLVARHGTIVIQEPFGELGGKPVALDTRFTLASITKTFTATLFLQFVEQGLINLDDPVGKYLPDFPTTGDRALMVRNLLNHTSGLEGHGEFGGLNNAWLDNVIANGPEWFQPGRTVVYNGMGFDLAGRLMEQVSGKSIFRLMHEQVFQPLGFRSDTTVADLAYGVDCTVENLARMGQTLLNKGSYGDVELIRPETFQQMLPRPTNTLYPALKNAEWDYGLGMSWMRHADPNAGKNGVPADATILSKNTIGHGSASVCMLEVDQDRDLVVTMTRNFGMKDLEKNMNRFLLAVRESCKE